MLRLIPLFKMAIIICGLFSISYADIGVGVSEAGTLSSVVTDVNDETRFIDTYRINQNFPNPFNPVTSIQYVLPKASDVKITVYNTLGQLVKTLVNKNQNAGEYTVTWNGLNDSGQQVTSGVYFYKIQAGDFIQTKKMLLVR